MFYYAERQGIRPLILAELGRELHPLRDLMTIWKLYRLMREFKPDVVHTHTAKAGFVGRIAAKLAGVPVILHTFHGHVFHGYFNQPMTWLFIQLERIAATFSDTIITLTESLRRELADQYHIARRARITVLPLGLDLEPFAQTPRHKGLFRAQWNIPTEAPLVGIVGRLVPVKNHRLFVEAAALIHKNNPSVRFAVIGDGELRDEIESYARERDLMDVFTFTGWQQDTVNVYSDLDVLVISSVNEGTPVTVIEALAAGCPVVSTAVGGVTELLENGALGSLVLSENAEVLAQAILSTLSNPPDTQHAQKMMLQRYGIDRLVQDLDSLYRGLLAKKRGQSKP